MSRAAVVALAASTAVGCFDARLDDGVFSCEQSRLCPTGLACVGGVCVSGAVADAGSIDAPGTPPDAAAAIASCRDVEGRANGVYTLTPNEGAPREVFCDMETDGGGWTVLVVNAEIDDEPDGCIPRIASTPDLSCGALALDADHAVLATDIEFTELLWLVVDIEDSAVSAYRYFRWNDPQSIPAETLWSLIPDSDSGELATLQPLPLVECQLATSGASGLRRVANEGVDGNEGGWSDGDVITIFDQNAIAGDNGRMSLMGVDAMNDSLSGLDDFQDGRGCSDAWAPKSSRGEGSRIMIR